MALIRRKGGIHRVGGKKRSKRQISGKKPKLPSISKLIKACDKQFSLNVRQNAYPKDKDIKFCYTCNHPNHWKKMHCGHFLSRYYKSARWDKDNARIQCMMCNLWKRGDPIAFRQNLLEEIGEKRVQAVEQKRYLTIKLSREYLTDLLTSLTT